MLSSSTITCHSVGKHHSALPLQQWAASGLKWQKKAKWSYDLCGCKKRVLVTMISAPASSRGWGHAACRMRSLHLCFSLPCLSVLCSGSCLRWFDDPLHLWSAKTVTSAENLYVYDKRESCSFCEALSLWKNIVSIKPSSLLRRSSPSTSVNVIFQQKINKDSLACSYIFCNPHPTNTATVWGPDPFLQSYPVRVLPGLKFPWAPCPAQ